jgi:hypothetical protein
MSQPSRKKAFVSFLSHLPSIVWIPIFVLGIAAFIGGIIGLFYALSHYEGVASVLMLAVAWGVIRLGSGASDYVEMPAAKVPGVMTALIILFFAGMGVAIDQTGNYLYNRPLEWFFCPSGTELRRGVQVYHPLPGRTDTTQDYTCAKPGENQITSRIGTGKVIAVRFVEYILIGYALIYLNRLYTWLRTRRAGPAPAS